MNAPQLDAASLPRKINIGCGFDRREGYLNVDSADFHKPDLLADVTNLSMLPDGHFDEALAIDVLEHIGRTQQVTALREWARLLRPGGSLHVRVPSVVDMVRLLQSDPSFKDVERQHYWVQMLYGTQAYAGDYHLCGYTCLTLVDLGRQAGLVLARAELKDEWLLDATFRKIAGPDELTNAEWVCHQYMTGLQRAPDPGGLSYWTTQLDTGAVSRRQVIEEFRRTAAA